MVYTQSKQANVIELLSGAVSELAGIRKELLVYFGGFALLTILPIDGISLGWILMLVGILGYFGAQYWLYRAMLRNAGMLQDEGWRFAEFFVMALVLIVPIMIGFNLFWIPGMILIAKWVMAPAFLVAQRRNLFQAIGESWTASNGSTFYLTIAILVIGVVWFIAFIPVIFLGEVLDFGNDAPMIGILMWMHLMPVMLAGLSVAAYRKLSDETASLTEVFA